MAETMARRCVLGAVVAACGILGIRSAEAVELTLEAGGWFPFLDGELLVAEGGLTATRVDFEEDLELDTSAAVPELGISLTLGRRNTFYFRYWRVRWEGEAVLDRELTIGDTVFGVATRTRSSLDVDVFAGGYRFDLIAGERLTLGAFLNVDTWLTDVEVDAPESALREREDLPIPIPTIGLATSFAIIPDWLEASVALNGIGFDFDEARASYINLRAGLAVVDLIPGLSATAGLRFLDLDVEVEDEDEGDRVDLDFRMVGPFVGVSYRFGGDAAPPPEPAASSAPAVTRTIDVPPPPERAWESGDPGSPPPPRSTEPGAGERPDLYWER